MGDRESAAGWTARRGPRWLALAALAAAALGLRLWGLDHQLPHFIEPDLYIVMGAQRAELEKGELDPAYVDWRVAPDWAGDEWDRYYPPLLSTLLGRLPGEKLALPPEEPLAVEQHLPRASGPILRGRALVALLSSLLVPLTYALARRFLGPGAGLLAAALVATSALHVWFSGTARPHAAAATPILLAVVAALWLRRRPTLLAYAAAALAAGLALATLQTGLLVLPALLAAHLLRERGGAGGSGVRTAVLGPLAGVAVLAACAHLAYPDVAAQFSLSGGGLGPDAPSPEGRKLFVAGQPLPLRFLGWPSFAGISELALWHDPALFLAAALGALLLASRSAWRAFRRHLPVASPGPAADLAVVAAHAVPYLFVLSIYGGTTERYLLPLVPYAACLAAHAWTGVAWRGAGKPGPRIRVRLAAAALLLLAFPTALALRIAWLRASPDTLEEAAAWLVEHADPELDPPAFAAGRLPPIAYEVGSVQRAMGIPHVQALRWPVYLANGARYPAGTPVYPLELTEWVRAGTSLEHLDGRLVVAETSRPVWAHPQAIGGLAALRRVSEPIARFGPRGRHGPDRGAGDAYTLDGDVASFGLEHSDMDRFVLRVLRARRLGPGVEIRRIDSHEPAERR